MKIDLRKFFGLEEYFFMNLDLKMDVKMNLRIITKNHAANPERESLKIDFEAVWPHRGHADSE